MTDRRDTPRGPTATELHRRTLAHEPRRPPLAAMPWPAPPQQSAHDQERVRQQERDAASFSPLVALRRCDYCGALSPQGCTASPCTFHGTASV